MAKVGGKLLKGSIQTRHSVSMLVLLCTGVTRELTFRPRPLRQRPLKLSSIGQIL